MKWPFEFYKIDGKFGDKRSYGLHSGVDMNGLGGGNSDCGTKLYPPTFGELIHTSNSKKGYGLIVVFKIQGIWGTRWIRYAHTKKVVSEIVDPNKPVALMGSTGNSKFCHLHFDVITKPLRNWRQYAKDKNQLNEYFEDPIGFVNKYKNFEGEKVTKKTDEIEDLKNELNLLREEYGYEQERVISCRKDRKKLQEQLAVKQQSVKSVVGYKLSSRKFLVTLGTVITTISSAVSGQVEWGQAITVLLGIAAAYLAAEGFVDGMEKRNGS